MNLFHAVLTSFRLTVTKTVTKEKTNERIETIGFHYSSNPFGFHNSESDWFESNNRGRYPILLTLRQVCRA